MEESFGRHPDAEVYLSQPGLGPVLGALDLQAFAALSASPGARGYYDARRSRGATHHQALRALANRLVGILHGCLRRHTTYNEDTAWHTTNQTLELQAA